MGREKKSGWKCTCLQRHDLTFLSTRDGVWKSCPQLEAVQVNPTETQCSLEKKNKKLNACSLRSDIIQKRHISESRCSAPSVLLEPWKSRLCEWSDIASLTVVLTFPEGSLKNTVEWGCIISAWDPWKREPDLRQIRWQSQDVWREACGVTLLAATRVMVSKGNL